MWDTHSHKQIISRYIASTWPQLSHGSWAPGLLLSLAWMRYGWPSSCQAWHASVSRQQAQGGLVILDQWTHLPTHLSTAFVRQEEWRERWEDSSYTADDLILNGWMALNGSKERGDWGWQTWERLVFGCTNVAALTSRTTFACRRSMPRRSTYIHSQRWLKASRTKLLLIKTLICFSEVKPLWQGLAWGRSLI